MPKNSKGLSINGTQPLTKYTQYDVTPKGQIVPSYNKQERQFDRNMLPTPRVYYVGVLQKFYPRKEQAAVLCPFHKDSNSPFSVDLKQRRFFCFSCFASGGNILGFYRRLHGVDFVKAVTDLGAWSYE